MTDEPQWRPVDEEILWIGATPLAKVQRDGNRWHYGTYGYNAAFSGFADSLEAAKQKVLAVLGYQRRAGVRIPGYER